MCVSVVTDDFLSLLLDFIYFFIYFKFHSLPNPACLRYLNVAVRDHSKILIFQFLAIWCYISGLYQAEYQLNQTRLNESSLLI